MRDVCKVWGSKIDAQFTVDGVGFLAFISFDDIFSAVERIYLIGEAGRVLDQATLGHETAQGLITDVQVEGLDTVAFTFPINERHRLTIARRRGMFGFRKTWLRVD
jgi:hypothetical protein